MLTPSDDDVRRALRVFAAGTDAATVPLDEAMLTELVDGPLGRRMRAVLEADRADRAQLRPLTPRQREVLDLIVESLERRHVAPSHPELAEAMGLRALATVHEHLYNLERKGWVTRDRLVVRGLALTPAAAARLAEEGAVKNLRESGDRARREVQHA